MTESDLPVDSAPADTAERPLHGATAAEVRPTERAAAPPGSRSDDGKRSGARHLATRQENHDTVPLPGVGLRARLARIGRSSQQPGSIPELEPILRAVRENHPKADIGVIHRAYLRAEECHRGVLRKSGDPYITHPLAVTTLLADLGMTPTTLAAALLHDTVEDTPYTLEQLTEEFGEEIAMLVDGVTKLDKLTYGDAAQAETFRKMIIAMSRDIRVLVIKLCDRMHNARTWKYVSKASAERKAKETLEIYAPLAHRLGMNTIKWELEDLSFKTLYPQRYDEIRRLVAERAPAREEYLTTVRRQIEEDLKGARITCEVTGRPKHYYSIYQKMIVRGRGFTDIYDLVGVRVLVDNVRDCYAVLGALHARWNPVPGRFKDYIAMPKFNMYQSLHTTVIGPGGKPVEIQIRTLQMHRRAEFGVAAHWKYKDEVSQRTQGGGGDVSDMTWLRQLLEWQKETGDPSEFLDSLRFEMNGSEVFVFTPKGDVQALPTGATPIDFAYAVHTEVGHRTMGARVNGRLVPLNSQLDNGDVVEIFTSKSADAGPSRDWLNFVRSARARNKIRQWFTKERREESIDRGRDLIARAMRKQHLPIQRLLSHDSLALLAQEMNHADVSALYSSVGEGQVSAQHVVQRLVAMLGGEDATEEDLAEATLPERRARRHAPGDPGVEVKGAPDVWVKLARCCTPVPGDDIIGFVTRGAGVSVHRADCANTVELRNTPGRIVEVEWAVNSQSVYLVQIHVEALDRPRLLSDITRVLSDSHVNILTASVTTTRDRIANSRFVFEMADPAHLDHVLKSIRTVDGVFDCYRITGTSVPEAEAVE